MEANVDRKFFLQTLINPALKYRLIRHVLLWSTALFLINRGFLYIAITIQDQTAIQTYANLSTLFFGSLIMSTYFIVTWLIQRCVLLRFRFVLFVGSLFLIHIIITALVRWHFLFFIEYLTLSNLPRMYSVQANHIARLAFWQVPFDPIIVGLFSFSLLYNYLLYGVGFKVFKDLFILKIKQEKLERENLLLEFNFLKAQVNPHFLFNTLNNIYSFSIKSPNKVPNTILKLADMMRYSLYETEAEFVPLVKELSFLESYVQLQRIRHEENTSLTYSVQGEAKSLMIPPLLLIVFVENAFKHGLQASTHEGWVHISLSIDGQSLLLTVKNNRPKTKPAFIGGIGLNNVRKRLNLLYADHYRLDIEEHATEFIISLNIILYEPTLPGRYRG